MYGSSHVLPAQCSLLALGERFCVGCSLFDQTEMMHESIMSQNITDLTSKTARQLMLTLHSRINYIRHPAGF